MTIYLSAFICLLGLAIYLLSDKPKISEAGRIAYQLGLAVFLLATGSKIVELFTRP